MFVRKRMTPEPVTIPPTTSIFEALDIMKKKNIRRLPVVDRGKLVGIVTEMDLLKASPSPATSLSIHEINYLLSKMGVKEIMATDVVTVGPDTTVEEAALLMRDYKIGGLPVVEDGKVVGIITETDIFDTFVDILGLRRAGSRLTIEIEDRPGVLADIARIIKEEDINIASLAVFNASGGRADLVMRLCTDDPEVVVGRLKDAGYQVLHVASHA